MLWETFMLIYSVFLRIKATIVSNTILIKVFLDFVELT